LGVKKVEEKIKLLVKIAYILSIKH
jgi:hypothetical protein